MSFRITGLSPSPFRHLFGLPDAELRRLGARRYVVDAKPGFPDRIEVRDAEPGETVLLVNHTHQPADNPYRASHAIFVREGADRPCDVVDEVPEVMRRRLLSLRAFDPDHLMIDADVVDGECAQELIGRLFENPRVAYIHAHYAKRGCYAARIDRVCASASAPDR
ncbi:MAG TPA: DUF1203 domain-containing protein [Thermoanaerobaculia bacterium]